MGFTVGLRCARLEEGFALWESYVREGCAHVYERGELGIDVCYEEFLADPAEGLLRVGRFCELEPTRARCEALVEKVRKGRAFAYRSSPELTSFAESVGERLAALGY